MSYTINVEKTLDAPIAEIFARFADHANYCRFPGIDESVLLREGTAETNGVGALRKIRSGGTELIEEITEFETEHRLGYRVLESRPLTLLHEGGLMQFEAVGSQTRVQWTSTFTIASPLRLPLLGGWLTKRLGPRFGRAFAATLRAAERQVKTDVSEA